MAKLAWHINVQLSGNVIISSGIDPMPVEGTDRIEVKIEPGVQDKVVHIHPVDASSIKFIIVKSSVYNDTLSFKASDGHDDSSVVVMNTPQVFTGGGIGLFGVTPNQMKFTNTSPDEANIEIFVARDATIPQP